MYFVFVEIVIDWYVVISIYILFIIMFFCLIFLNFVNSIFERNIKGIVFYFGGFGSYFRKKIFFCMVYMYLFNLFIIRNRIYIVLFKFVLIYMYM